MSMTAGLHKDDMTCWCSACGEYVYVDENDIVIIKYNKYNF